MRNRRLSLSAALGAALALVVATTAFAFSSSNAVNYANQWWNSRNPAYVAYGNDCANYVSQVQFAGGYPINTSANNPWYANYGPGLAYSQSWRLVQYNRGFFLTDGGSVIRTYHGVKTAYPTGVALGDIVYYAWQNDHTFASNSHGSVVTVLNGRATSSAYTGVLINAHSNDRYHEFFTLPGMNLYWQTTYIEIVHTRRP